MSVPAERGPGTTESLIEALDDAVRENLANVRADGSYPSPSQRYLDALEAINVRLSTGQAPSVAAQFEALGYDLASIEAAVEELDRLSGLARINFVEGWNRHAEASDHPAPPGASGASTETPT